MGLTLLPFQFSQDFWSLDSTQPLLQVFSHFYLDLFSLPTWPYLNFKASKSIFFPLALTQLAKYLTESFETYYLKYSCYDSDLF